MITSANLAIGYRKFEALKELGLGVNVKDAEKENATRIEQMKALKMEAAREGKGDTGKQILFQRTGKFSPVAFSAAELVERFMNSGATVYLKEKVTKDGSKFYLVVSETEAGESTTSLSSKAQELVIKSSRKWFRTVAIWQNRDATITVNMSGDVRDDESREVQQVKQVRFVSSKPCLI